MANKIISMENVKLIRLLSSLGLGKKTIARQLSIFKNTVKEYLSKEEQSVVHSTEDDADKMERLRNFFPYCREELRRKGVTRQILWAELVLQSN